MEAEYERSISEKGRTFLILPANIRSYNRLEIRRHTVRYSINPVCSPSLRFPVCRVRTRLVPSVTGNVTVKLRV